jgi:RNA polymerase sigma factor (sigma-70 family)
MSTHLVFNGIEAAEKARLQTYWEQKLPRMQKLLSPYRADLLEIRLTVSPRGRGSRSAGYEVRAVIHLPTGTLAAEADDKDPLVALDRVADALVTEIKRHKELVRRDFIYKRKSRNRDNLSAAGAMLQRDAEGGRREDFFQLLRPQLRFLRNYARRELRILELQGLLHRGEVTEDDVLDEVLTRAWQRFADRPRHLRLDLWLTDLLHDTLERWVKQEPRRHASLEEKVGETWPDEVPQPDEEEWWAPLLGEEETFTLGDLIPDVRATDAWEQLDAEEQKDRILSLLAELPPAQRQAFLLHALEDYNTAEIALLQGRPEGEVKADIEAARKTLRDRLLAGGHARKKGEMATAAETSGD